MPVKTTINKSEEVRKLKASGVKSASEIIARLKSRGITIAPAQVYQVLAGKKGKNRAKRTTATSSHLMSKPDVLDSAVVFVRHAGGMQKARELLAKLSLLHN